MKKNWRIGIDARFLGARGGFGIGVYTQELLAALRQRDKKNRYFILVNKKALFEVPLAENFEVVVADFPPYSLSEQLFYASFLRGLKLDLIHFTNFNAPSVGPLPPSIVTIHDLTLLFFPGRTKKGLLHRLGYHYVIERASERAQKVIAVSEHTKKEIVRELGLAPSKIEVIYEAPAKRFRPLKDKTQVSRLLRRFGISRDYLLYVGQWRKHKNLINLIRAYALLKKTTSLPHELVLAGEGDFESSEIPALVKKLALTKEVVLTGFVPDEELAALYSGAALFVFPSLYEGFGIPPLEAMACGCPVAAARSSSLPEILNEAALFFDPRKVEEMAGVMNRILSSFSLRRELAEKGFQRVKKFSWRKTANKTLKLYQEVLRGQKAQVILRR